MFRTLATVLALAGGILSAHTQELILRYSLAIPENNLVSEGNKMLAEKARELSNGEIDAELYWAGSLGKQEEMLPMLSSGAVDLATVVTSHMGETPLLGFMNTTFNTFHDAEQLLSISRHLYENSAGFQKELEFIGARPLMLQHLPAYRLLCTKPVRTMADFEGLRVRASGAFVPLMWQAVGAIPVNLVLAEMYDGLSRGLIDCSFLPASFFESLKLYEVAKYLIDVPFGMIEFAPTLVSNASWVSLTDEQREIMTEAAKQAEAFSLENTEAKSAKSVQSLLEQGVEMVEFQDPEALISAMPDMVQVWLDRQIAEGRGEDAQKIADYVRSRLSKD